MDRRGFLMAGAAFATCGCAGIRGETPVRFLVAADVHYRPGVFPHDTSGQLERIVARGVSEKVDFGIQLGDFQHNALRDRPFIDIWTGAPFETHSVIGNHDDDASREEETRAAFGLERGWYRFDRRGIRFIVLDTNYARIDGRYVHFGYGSGIVPWRLPAGDRMRLHPDEFDFLEDSIRSAEGVCVVASHRSLAGDDPDAERVRRIFAAANGESRRKVALALNGHNHCDRLQEKEGVPYYTVNSPNHCWIPLRHGAYPDEDVRRWREIDHVIAYDGTPLSAVVSMWPDGRFSVSGMKGGFWRGIAPAQIVPSFPGGFSASIRDRPEPQGPGR